MVAITRKGKDLVGKSRRFFSVRPRCVEVGEKYSDGWTCHERPARCDANKLVGISGQQLSGGSSGPRTMTVGLLIKHISQ